jgi:hypothetical protein
MAGDLDSADHGPRSTTHSSNFGNEVPRPAAKVSNFPDHCVPVPAHHAWITLPADSLDRSGALSDEAEDVPAQRPELTRFVLARGFDELNSQAGRFEVQGQLAPRRLGDRHPDCWTVVACHMGSSNKCFLDEFERGHETPRQSAGSVGCERLKEKRLHIQLLDGKSTNRFQNSVSRSHCWLRARLNRTNGPP